jgi:archaetidylinositol phosphate synthase
MSYPLFDNIPTSSKKKTGPMPDFSDPKRVNDIWLGQLERAALDWIVKRLPTWVVPDLLTAIGLGGALIIFAGYALSNLNRNYLWLSSFGFLLNWFGDSLDGSLARYRKIERPRYGFFVDHIIDSLVDVLIFLGLGLSPYISFPVASMVLVSYLLLSVYVFLSTSVNGVFRISFGHFGPTEMRVLAILMNTLMFFAGRPQISLPFGTYGVFDVCAGIVAVVLFCVYVYASIVQSIELAKLDERLAKKK